MYEFPTTRPISVFIHVRSGDATVTAEERDNAVVAVRPADDSDASRDAAAATQVELRDDTLVVRAPEHGGGWLWRHGGVRVDVRVPLDCQLTVKGAAASVRAPGRWRQASLHTASGPITVGDVTGDLDATSASGRLVIGQVDGSLRASSASGDIAVESVGGDASLRSASGDLRLGDAAASVAARTASGRIDLRRTRRGEVRARSASGDVTVGVAPGTGVYLDVTTVSGDTRSDLDVGDGSSSGRADLTVRIRTVNGDASVLRAVDAVASTGSAGWTRSVGWAGSTGPTGSAEPQG